LRYPDFKDYEVYLGVHSCTGYHSGDYLIFDKEYASCGTIKQVLINKFDSEKTINTKSVFLFVVSSLRDSSQPASQQAINQSQEIRYSSQNLLFRLEHSRNSLLRPTTKNYKSNTDLEIQ
jgi:hypothetical protein